MAKQKSQSVMITSGPKGFLNQFFEYSMGLQSSVMKLLQGTVIAYTLVTQQIKNYFMFDLMIVRTTDIRTNKNLSFLSIF